MAVLRKNVLMWTARPQRNNTTGSRTLPNTVYLAKVGAYLKAVPASSYKKLPISALGAEFEAHVEPGTDIRTGDRILIITMLDGVTPWPDFLALTDPAHAQASTYVNWWVKYAYERPPGPGNYRPLYLIRRRTGGEEYGV